MQFIVVGTSLEEGEKKLQNQSAWQETVGKLKKATIEGSDIFKVTGHRS